MIIVSKYRNITHNMRKFTVFFLILFQLLYVGKASNVTSFQIPSKITSFRFDIQDIQCYSIACNQNAFVFITSNKSLFVFDGFTWKNIFLAERCTLISGENATVYVSGPTFAGKIIFKANGVPVIEKIAKNALPRVKIPEVKMELEPSFPIHLHADGTVDVTNIKTGESWPLTVNVNALSEPRIGVVLDQNHGMWILYKDQVKRLDIFEYAKFYEPFIPYKTGDVFHTTEPSSGNSLKNPKQNAIVEALKERELIADSLIIDLEGNIWVRCRKIIKSQPQLYVIPNYPSHEIHLLKIAYPEYGLSDISVIIPLCDGNVALQGKEGVVLFDIHKYLNTSRSVSLLIHKMTDDGGQVISQGYFGIEDQHPHIFVNSSVENISFYFAATDMRNADQFLYSTLLEGRDTQWSSWKDISYASFGCLGSGEYRFHVRAMSDNGTIAPETSVAFTIRTPLFIRWWAWMVYSGVVVILIYLYWIRRKINFEKDKAKLEYMLNERTAELMTEKAKTDDLLANLLPKDTADELKNTGKATSQKYNMVTVLFSDIQGFTKIAEEMNPEKLIDELDNFFFHFDSVVEKYNIEKIKTIGDAYMCAGGIPYKNRTNPVEVVLAALEMQDYMKQLRQKNVNIWDLRIGVHTGAVIAGVVGHKRVSYDIWGDTVNTASRMESSGEVGKVNISGQTYEMIKEFFICEYRGRMPVKYKGDIDMFFVKAIRPELSIDLKVIPNKSFFVHLQILRLQDLEEFILQKMTEELPSNIVFHNSRQTKDVYSVVELIGRAESLSTEDILLVRTAALFLNLGYCQNYKDHILNSIRAAEAILPKFKYTLEQIVVVNQLINATNTRYNHVGKLESVLIDAYNNYIGRVDYLFLSIDLFQEVKQQNGGISEKEWFNQQVRFLEHFAFYTSTATLLREVTAEEQILKIKEYAKID